MNTTPSTGTGRAADHEQVPVLHDPQERVAADAALSRAKRLGAAALVAASLAALAGVAMLLADPAPGSTLEGVLGVAAAICGLGTAVLTVVAVVYVQVKGLWPRVPIRARYVLWAILAIAIANSLWSQISSLR